MINRLIHYGIVLMLIAALSAGILALANNKTSPIIDKMKIDLKENARKEVLKKASKFEDKIKIDDYEFIKAFDENNNLIGYVVETKESGYADIIEFILGIDKTGKITGLKVISMKETPGLGAKIENKDWQEKWVGRDKNYMFNKSVDAFAGATISPNAVYTGIKKVLNSFEKIKE